jgi:serine O-acetyltransferase
VTLERANGVGLPSASTPDWSRERCRRFWDPGRRLLKTIRDYQRPGLAALLLRPLCILRHRFWSVVTGAEIQLNSKIQGGLLIPHPNGIVVHPDARIGPNCLLFQQVTLGSGGSIPGVPTLGGHVDVGAGAKILGGVTVGDHAKIGANAVVLCDVPSYAVAVGVPAKVIRRGPQAEQESSNHNTVDLKKGGNACE